MSGIRSGLGIQFLARIFDKDWSRSGSERVLDILLEALVKIDELYLRLTPNTPSIYKSGVRYYHYADREEWLAIPECLHERIADCKSLSAWLVAEYRVSGIDPGAKCVKKYNTIETDFGPLLLYHIQVQRSDGSLEDPSVQLGMTATNGEPDGYIPVPGVPWVIVNGLTHAIGAAIKGDQKALRQLEEMGDRAAAGDGRYKYLVKVAQTIREKGYTPEQDQWVRFADGSWGWA
jgi:hypothetical protein